MDKELNGSNQENQCYHLTPRGCMGEQGGGGKHSVAGLLTSDKYFSWGVNRLEVKRDRQPLCHMTEMQLYHSLYSLAPIMI